MRTDDIRGAQPRKLDIAFNSVKEQFKKGQVVYYNKNYVGNGDIVSNLKESPLDNIKIRPSSKRISK